MQIATAPYCLVERRQGDRRQHFDRRSKARFDPIHPDRRTGAKRRKKNDDGLSSLQALSG